MRRSRQHDQQPSDAEVASNMADAVGYLGRVARDAGLIAIADDLYVIQCKLRQVRDQLVGSHSKAPTSAPHKPPGSRMN
jgi:hypothetical protein